MNSVAFKTDELEIKAESLKEKLTQINEKIQHEIQTNASITQNQVEYEQRYNALCADYEKTKTEYYKTLQTIEDTKSRKLKADKFFAELKSINASISEFDEKMFERLAGKIIVKDEEIQVEWKG